MILSNVRIQEALDKHWVTIDPEPTPRRLGDGGGKCPYQTSAVDLRLGNEIAYLKGDLPAHVDLRKGDFNKLFGPHSEKFQLVEQQPYVPEPNRLVLGKTLERVELPLPVDGGPSLAARVEGKSSYARCGLLVHFTVDGQPFRNDSQFQHQSNPGGR